MYHGGTIEFRAENLPGIDYLNSLIIWGSEKKFTLDNVLVILDKLNNPQNKIPSIIIGGTNGKGSVSAAVSSILANAGHRVGLNISPHLSCVSERIVIDGYSADKILISDTLMEIKQLSESINILLSYHEAITICSFLIFSREKINYAVYEVGLGGRLDAANSIKSPIISAIVSVDLDHQKILGNTKIKIATEKSGIFRHGGIGVLGRVDQEILTYFRKLSKKISMKLISYDNNVYLDRSSEECLTYYLDDSGFKIPLRHKLLGAHQEHNMSVAVAVAKEIGISKSACEQGIANIFWPARLETLKYNSKELILDCAHNPGGVETLIAYFKSRGYEKISMGFGAIDSKNWQKMLELLIPYVSSWSILEPESNIAVPAGEILSFLERRGVMNISVYARNYLKFLDEFASKDNKLNIVAGSIYLVGSLRKLITEEIPALWYVDAKGQANGQSADIQQ